MEKPTLRGRKMGGILFTNEKLDKKFFAWICKKLYGYYKMDFDPIRYPLMIDVDNPNDIRVESLHDKLWRINRNMNFMIYYICTFPWRIGMYLYRKCFVIPRIKKARIKRMNKIWGRG